MREKPDFQIIPWKQFKQVSLKPHLIGFIAMWFISTITFAVMLASGVRNTGRFSNERNILHAVYVFVLFVYLIRTGPSLNELPDISPQFFPRLKIGKFIPAVLIAILFLGEVSHQLEGLVRLLILISTIIILIIWRREIRLRSVSLGIIVALIAFLGGWIWYQNQYFPIEIFTLFIIFVVPIFVAAGLLNKRTGLDGSELFRGQYKKAVLSFLYGCVLFIPLGLANAAAGSPGPWMTWVTRWWMPLSMPFFSGIVEEAMWRLLVVSLCYFLLRPAFNKKPAIAVAIATLFSAIIFGIGHKGNFLDTFLITGLLYGLPMAVIFARRDWEHAIGAHYMINMIPTLMVFLET